jgi:hypothetical protein
MRLPIRQNQKKARPAKGLRPSLAKATAGSMNIKKGTRNRNNRNMASEIGRKYIIFLHILYQIIILLFWSYIPGVNNLIQVLNNDSTA